MSGAVTPCSRNFPACVINVINGCAPKHNGSSSSSSEPVNLRRGCRLRRAGHLPAQAVPACMLLDNWARDIRDPFPSQCSCSRSATRPSLALCAKSMKVMTCACALEIPQTAARGIQQMWGGTHSTRTESPGGWGDFCICCDSSKQARSRLAAGSVEAWRCLGAVLESAGTSSSHHTRVAKWRMQVKVPQEVLQKTVEDC